jgi:geranylgeranyl diphosphate synthase, type II
VAADERHLPVTGDALAERLHRAVLSLLPVPAGSSDLAHFAALMRDYPSRGGKRMRGKLVVRSTAAHGGDTEAVIDVAAALELFQNWVLVHDDIEDDSEERRGAPALHRTVGVPLALNVGDAMHVYMWDALLRLRTRPGFDADAIRGEFLWMIHRTAEGQHLDLTWVAQERFDVDEDEYFQMVRRKTAAYTVVGPLRLGAHASARPPHPALASIGERLGSAFQIRDDVLNLLPADGSGYGKEFAGDLYEGKRTLVLAHALANASADEAAEAVARLRPPRARRTREDVAWLLSLIERHGSLRYAQARAEALAEGALRDLQAVAGELPVSVAANALVADLRALTRRVA